MNVEMCFNVGGSQGCGLHEKHGSTMDQSVSDPVAYRMQYRSQRPGTDAKMDHPGAFGEEFLKTGGSVTAFVDRGINNVADQIAPRRRIMMVVRMMRRRSRSAVMMRRRCRFGMMMRSRSRFGMMMRGRSRFSLMVRRRRTPLCRTRSRTLSHQTGIRQCETQNCGGNRTECALFHEKLLSQKRKIQ